MAFKDLWSQKTWAKQSKLFAVKHDCDITGDEVNPDAVFESIAQLNAVKSSGNLAQIQQAFAQTTQNFILCSSLSPESLCKIEFEQYLIEILQNPPNQEIKQFVLTIIISWLDRWPGESSFIVSVTAADYITNLIFSETNDERSQVLTLNLLSRIIIISPDVKVFLTNECSIVKHLVDAFFAWENEKIRDLILLCLWSILHTTPHPSFQQVSDVTKLFSNMFTEEDSSNFEKRLYLASVFAECDSTCSFVMCDIFPVVDALSRFTEMTYESKVSLLNLLIALLDANDTCSSMTVLGSITWDFFLSLSEEREDIEPEEEEALDETRIAAARLLCAIFKNEECSQDLIISAFENEVFNILIDWSDTKKYQLKRWSVIAIMQVLMVNQIKEVLEFFLSDKCIIERMKSYLELDSIVVTREVLLAIGSIGALCAIELPSTASTMESLEITEHAGLILESIEDSKKLDNSKDLIEELQEKLSELQEDL